VFLTVRNTPSYTTVVINRLTSWNFN